MTHAAIQSVHDTEDPVFEYLDGIAAEVIAGKTDRVGPLSTGESLYVALASNQLELVPGYNVAQALDRLGVEWTTALVQRWRYRHTTVAVSHAQLSEAPGYAELLESVLSSPDMSSQLRERIRTDRERDPMAALRDAHVLYRLADCRAMNRIELDEGASQS